MIEPWMREAPVLALSGRILDRLDATPTSERRRALSFVLEEQTFPELYLAGSLQDREYAWSLTRKMEAAGWIRIELDPRRGQSPIEYERRPRLRFQNQAEGQLRELCGRPVRTDPWGEEWRTGCANAQWIPNALREVLAGLRHRIGNRTVTEMLDRWRQVATRDFGTRSLREVSAQLFWGLSKELDSRIDLVTQLRAAHGLEALPELPILMPATVAATWQHAGVLFVENLGSYAACSRGHIHPAIPLAIVYAAGFKSSARRIRQPNMSIVAFDATNAAEQRAFLTWLWGGGAQDVPVYFWGDLDAAGMRILRELRVVFPGMQAWRPGYEPMLERIRAGDGHLPAEADKENQVEVLETGCDYADQVLIPAMQETGMFYDQEGVSLQAESPRWKVST